MDKREEELRISEILVNTLLTIAIVILTYIIAISNDYLSKNYPWAGSLLGIL